MDARVSLTFLVAFASLLADAYITKVFYKKMECETDPSVAVNPICELKPIKRDVKNIALGWTLLRSTPKIFVRLINFQKTYTNHFMPGFLDSTQNYCEIANQTTPASAFVINAIKHFSPDVLGMYLENLHYCPIKAGPLFFNTTFVSNITDQPFIPPGEYKIIYRFFDGNNKTLYKLTLHSIRQDKNPRSYRN